MIADKEKKKGLRFLLIVFTGTVLAVLLHQLRHDPLMTLSTKAKSIIITSGYFPPVAFLGLALAFGIMGFMFLMIQNTLRGTKQTKGTVFGVALGGMYLVGMMEAYVVYPVSLFGEFYTGMVDGIGILFMSFLLGKYMAVDTPGTKNLKYSTFSVFLMIPVVYLLMRYFLYAGIHIESSYSTKPLATFIWTAGMGCWIGIMYMLIGRGIAYEKPLKHAMAFGGMVFGVNWLVFNLFALLFIKVPVLDLLYRSIGDAVAVILGVYISSFFRRKLARN